MTKDNTEVALEIEFNQLNESSIIDKIKYLEHVNDIKNRLYDLIVIKHSIKNWNIEVTKNSLIISNECSRLNIPHEIVVEIIKKLNDINYCV